MLAACTEAREARREKEAFDCLTRQFQPMFPIAVNGTGAVARIQNLQWLRVSPVSPETRPLRIRGTGDNDVSSRLYV